MDDTDKKIEALMVHLEVIEAAIKSAHAALTYVQHDIERGHYFPTERTGDLIERCLGIKGKIS